MAATVRPVPVLGFDHTPDARLRGYDWTADTRTIEDLLRSPPDQSLVIPLAHQRTQDDLLLQYRLRILDSQAAAHVFPFDDNNPVWVIFRDTSGVLQLLRLMLYMRLNEAAAPHVPPAAENGEWMWWSVRLAGTGIASTHSNGSHPVSIAYIADCRVGPLWRAYPTVEAVLVTNWLAKYAISELRLWEGRLPPHEPALGAERLLDGRLDGREPGLIGYWKFDEGSGNRVLDSSSFARHGTSKGGQWILANASGLSLDCALEDVARLRHDVKELKKRIVGQQPNLAAAEQKKGRLEAHIRELQAQKAGTAAELKPKLDAIERQIVEENTRHEKWLKDIEYLGTVSLDYFSEEIAREMNAAVEGQKNSAYQLERVAVDVKVLPVHSEEAGVKDYRVMFPDADAQIDPQQLSTLRFGFEVRPPEPEPGPIKVPDVRGYTELAAQRKLREVGLRMAVMEQATDDPEKVGRVVAQIVEEQIDNQRVVKQIEEGGVEVHPISVVTVFIGHASYSGARGMTAGRYEPGT